MNRAIDLIAGAFQIIIELAALAAFIVFALVAAGVITGVLTP